MNVSTITITQEEALAKLDQYKRVVDKKRVPEDEKLRQLYRSVSKGARVLNLAAAFAQTGLNELEQPRLAIARADKATIYCFRNPYKLTGRWDQSRGAAGFSVDERWDQAKSQANILLPDDTFSFSKAAQWSSLKSPVPHMPPDIRPKFGFHNYHILFEVKAWTASYPVDPFLMRRISGLLFVVEAEWELTELEASLLSSMQAGN